MALLRLHIIGLVIITLCTPSWSASTDLSALKAQVQDLLKRIDHLEKKQSDHSPDIVTSDTTEALSTPTPIERRDKSPMSLKISGHINRGVWVANNGVSTNTVHVDNDNSPSRLTITGSGHWSEETTVGGTFELGIETNSTDEFNINNVNDPRTRPTIRIADLFVKNQTFGELYVGHGSTASDGTMENTDLSKTTLLSAGGSMSFIAGATVFSNAVTGALINPDGDAAKADRIFDPGDGLFRRNRIRYNTPAWLGMSLQASHYFRGSDNNWDIVLKYGSTIHDIIVRAQAAFMQRNNNNRTANSIMGGTASAAYKQFNASAGALFPNGISLYAGLVLRDWLVTDPNNGNVFNVRNGTGYTGKVGYQFSYFDAGITALAVDFGRHMGMFFNVARPQDVYSGTVYGIFAVQHLDRIATELYAGYRHFKLCSNVPGETYNDIRAFLMGARVKL